MKIVSSGIKYHQLGVCVCVCGGNSGSEERACLLGMQAGRHTVRSEL